MDTNAVSEIAEQIRTLDTEVKQRWQDLDATNATILDLIDQERSGADVVKQLVRARQNRTVLETEIADLSSLKRRRMTDLERIAAEVVAQRQRDAADAKAAEEALLGETRDRIVNTLCQAAGALLEIMEPRDLGLADYVDLADQGKASLPTVAERFSDHLACLLRSRRADLGSVLSEIAAERSWRDRASSLVQIRAIRKRAELAAHETVTDLISSACKASGDDDVLDDLTGPVGHELRARQERQRLISDRVQVAVAQ